MAAPGKCLLVTGAPGVGKTTLITRVFEALKASNPNLKVEGFYTREIREGGGQRVGFEVVTLDGRTAPLASCTISTYGIAVLCIDSFDGPNGVNLLVQLLEWTSSESFRWPTVGRYKVDIASFESLALPVLQVKEDTDLYIIDEIGKMELYSSSFLPAVLKVLESKVPVLASVPIPKFGRDIPGVARVKNHPGAKIYTLIADNRESIREQIYSQLFDLLPKRSE